ncbi:MAG: hypothetical protein Q8M65_00205 [Rhodoglobus sp.]|nr:hypothetical protein [Rhodoglobus sp.]
MSTFRTPVGPQPPSVYWRRRLVLGLGLIAVIVVILLIVVRPGSGTSTPVVTKSATPTPSATPQPTSAAGQVECDLSKVTLNATTDSNSYDAGVLPNLSFTLLSLMAEDCIIEAGSDLQEFRITSGDELIWSSKDCQTGEVPATTILKRGTPLQGPSLTWDRTRSATDTCDIARDPVIANGSSYHLQVIIGELTSANSTQFLLY